MTSMLEVKWCNFLLSVLWLIIKTTRLRSRNIVIYIEILRDSYYILTAYLHWICKVFFLTGFKRLAQLSYLQFAIVY